MHFLLASDLSRAIQERVEFVMHCHTMTLACSRSDMPSFSGPGAIHLGIDRILRFTMYAESDERRVIPSDLRSGDLLPKDATYKLTAIDRHGAQWCANQVAPFNVENCANSKYATLMGDISEISSTTHRFLEGLHAQLAESRLRLYIFDDVPIPLTAGATNDDDSDDALERRGNGSVNTIATLNILNHKLRFTTNGDLLKTVVTSTAFIHQIEKRTVEALQFVLGRQIWWTLSQKEVGDKCVTRIRSASLYPVAKPCLPPIHSTYYYDHTECVWLLFAKYFEYVSAATGDNWHSLTRYYYSVVEAKGAGFDTHCLALSVAVEGVLKASPTLVVPPNEQFALAIAEVLKHLRTWTCQLDPADESVLRNRLTGCINQLRIPRALDRLVRLKKLGVISEDELHAWRELRNKMAHGHQADQRPSQDELNQIARVTTLLHKLMFQVIGYSGKYTDYGTRGFPTREFAAVVS